MEYRILGSTGVKISSFCLGTDNFADPTPELIYLILVMFMQMVKVKEL